MQLLRKGSWRREQLAARAEKERKMDAGVFGLRPTCQLIGLTGLTNIETVVE